MGRSGGSMCVCVCVCGGGAYDIVVCVWEEVWRERECEVVGDRVWVWV